MEAVTARLPRGVEPGGRFDAWRPSRPQYVVCDVDGTLIGKHATATEVVVDAVARAQAAGLRVGFATGRMRRAVEPLWRQLGAVGPHVLHNGAEVRAEGGTVAAWCLEPDQIEGLIRLAHEHNDGYVEIYTDDAYLATSWDDRARPHWGILGAEPDGVITAASDLGDAPALKATFALFDLSKVTVLEQAVAGIGLLPGTAGSPRTPDLTYVNVTHGDADKGRALARAAQHLGIGLEQTAAVGDATNDLSMLAVVGTAIAMGQAPEAVRQAAHLVVPDVNADGVAVALDAIAAWHAGDAADPS